MAKPIEFEKFKEIKKYQLLGMTKTAIAEKLGISTSAVRTWWTVDEDGYRALGKRDEYELDNYREFIVSLLKVCPQIRETNILYKLKEQFPDFEVKRSTFYRYISKLREQTGFVVDRSRKTTVRATPEPGYEAQVDFGQYKMKDMYGRTVRVYFFCMVLSYSRMRFAYFSVDPFTTKTAIDAHNFAFKYFGGRTQTIVYDQDRIFVVSENLGNIIFVKEFEEYVKSLDYSVVLCRPRDPQTKGKVENLVKMIKESFLLGRDYTGIDSLNSACLAWLDREGNNIPHASTLKPPRELFLEEAKHLKKVAPSGRSKNNIVAVDAYNCVNFDGNKYELPLHSIAQHQKVRVEDDDGLLLLYDAVSNTLLCKHKRCGDEGQIIKLKEKETKMVIPLAQLRKMFADYEKAMLFLELLEKSAGRYLSSQAMRLIRLTNYYKTEQILEAINYCLDNGKPNVYELASFLTYRHGESFAKKSMPYRDYNNCIKRARQIKEALHG